MYHTEKVLYRLLHNDKARFMYQSSTYKWRTRQPSCIQEPSVSVTKYPRSAHSQDKQNSYWHFVDVGVGGGGMGWGGYSSESQSLESHSPSSSWFDTHPGTSHTMQTYRSSLFVLCLFACLFFCFNSLYVWVLCLHVCLCATFTLCVCRGQKMVLNNLRLELQIIVSHCAGFEN